MSIKNILKQYDIRPSKRLGQNFLVCENPINKLIKAAELEPNDVVLEIGPGLGALTCCLAKQVKQVIAIEKDTRLAEALSDILKYENVENVEIINADALKFQMTNVKCQINDKCQMSKYKVVANLPYNIAAAVVMQFLENKNPPEIIAVMLQKEVAQRMCASPPRMNKLAVFSQFYSDVKIIGSIPKKCFYPQPKVDSAIIKIAPQKNNQSIINNQLFSQIVRAGFSHPRKQLLGNLSKELNLPRDKTQTWLQKNKIKPNQRAETLAVENWLALAQDPPEGWAPKGGPLVYPQGK